MLTRFGFNVGSPRIGFNDKNKKTRKTAIHADTARKFFKDTSPLEIRQWYSNELQTWFRQQRTFDHRGIFILDQSHLVVPDNKNYKDAVKMPVDEHGQLYANIGALTAEQKQGLIYHPCYALSTLLNVAMERPQFHVAGYEMGPGNEDELIQANNTLYLEKMLFWFMRKKITVSLIWMITLHGWPDYLKHLGKSSSTSWKHSRRLV